MNADTTRLRITLPKALAASVDQLVGRQKRDTFIVEAVAAKLERANHERTLDDSADFVGNDSPRDWESPEEMDAQVRKGDGNA